MKPLKSHESVGEAKRLEKAAEWMQRLRDESATERDIVRWVQWCEDDPRNRQAFDRAQEFWHVSGALAQEIVDGDLASAPGHGVRSRSNPFVWLQAALTDRWSSLEVAWYTNRRGMQMAATAVVLVLALSLVGLRMIVERHIAQDTDLVAAAVAEPVRAAELSDGSKMELAAKSIVAVHYTEARRSLELRGGEAYFTVAPNKQRPFVVAAGAVRVRAVGTAFDVRRAGDRIVVTVTKGTVDVYLSDTDAGEGSADGAVEPIKAHLVRVAAGNQVTWDDAKAKDPVVASVDTSAALGWRDGRLTYSNEPLSSVIADFNRYSQRPVTISNQSIGDMRFSGTLRADSTEEWLRALPGEFPVQVEDHGGVDVIELQIPQHS